jgi:hypothetical protein
VLAFLAPRVSLLIFFSSHMCPKLIFLNTIYCTYATLQSSTSGHVLSLEAQVLFMMTDGLVISASVSVQALVLIFLIIFRKKFKSLDNVERALAVAVFILFTFVHLAATLTSLSQNEYARIFVKDAILSKEEAVSLISAAEAESTALGGWTTARHKAYPTTDISCYTVKSPLVIGSSSYNFIAWLNKTVESRVFPILGNWFHVPVDDLFMKDLFLVKYDADGQRSLPEHRDSSVISFNIALSQVAEDFQGGGTRFVISDRIENINRGSMLGHESGVYHAGHPITSGKRYILVGFVNIRSRFGKWFWRGFGSLATCLVHPDQQTACRSTWWALMYEIREPSRELYQFLFGGGTKSGKIEDGSINDRSSQSSVIWAIFFTLLLGALLVILCFLLFICCCWDLYYDWCEKPKEEEENKDL